MLLIPGRQEPDTQPEVIDFVYSVIVVLLLGVLVLGSLSLMLLLRNRYVEALLETLLVIGVVLLILGWVWKPHGGMAGIGTVFSRYLMSVGMPIEQWLHTLADLAHRQDEPGAVRRRSLRGHGAAPVVGDRRRVGDTRRFRQCGTLAGRSSEFRVGTWR